MIYFVTAMLKEQVHAQALGFTKTVYLFGWGDTKGEAQDNVAAYLTGSEIKVEKTDSSAALEQNAARYAFPEQIVGLPEHLAVTAILRQMPEFHEESMASYYKRALKMIAGKKLLASQQAAVLT